MAGSLAIGRMQAALGQATNELFADYGCALSVIGYFETGQDFLGNLDFKDVVGLSAGDSLYVPRRPRHPRPKYVSYLSPGTSIQALSPFDERPEDCFGRTSMHLSFTEWESPLMHDGAVVQRGVYAVILEAAVQVRDGGDWAADVDILKALNGPLIQRPSDLPPCTHEDSNRSFGKCMALETWGQVIDTPEGILITKSHMNWVARLALAAVLTQHSKVRDQQVFVCQPDTCGRCVVEHVLISRNTIIID
ncbi:Uu.00g015670.m01.CDS01 [Anthostomella pinea]|uniref:Uu.00g015670.m01.CDS01 n=1 Tax=Anthostomella pinea TaxID=933095 RepID=A0AAI8VYJ7_9PEZI|nr:Uu.00g015670.m01.CDS01 [Anthostomella pinea]